MRHPQRGLAENGGKLSRIKEQSVENNYIDHIDKAQSLSCDTTAEQFLDHFPLGGAIWRIFWMHCWQPGRFPIYDQHVHRAMSYIENHQREDLASMKDEIKIRIYLDRYLPFYSQFAGIDPRQVDRALWACGKHIKTSPFPDLAPS